MSTQPSASGAASSRFARPVAFVRDLPIWTKLGLIMIVPTLATIVVGTAGLLDQVDQASGAERARSLTVLSGDAGALVHTLQDERAIAIQLLTTPPANSGAFKDGYAKQQAKVDATLQKYKVSRTTITDTPDNLNALLGGIDAQLNELPTLRGKIGQLNTMPLTVAENSYRVLISDLLEIRDLSAQLTGDTTLTDRMRAAGAVALAKEFVSQERVVVLRALAAGTFSTADRNSYVAARKGQELARATFNAVAIADQQEFFDRTVTGPQVREVLNYEGELDSLRPDQNPTTVVSAAAWDKAMIGQSDLMNQVEVALNQQAQVAASDLGEQVQRRVLIETGLLLMTLLLGVLFAWLVARSMARSLRDLRQGALAVAQYGLPQAVARLRDPALASHLSPSGVALQIAEPLPVRSNDEFGQVTEAFNAVHLEAVRTAAEQAALRSSVATMFVNLARRSQILVDRLIGHLDRLERGEQDPDRLSELFQLDHLATRMRRNDENLLVLAGADSTRIQREPAALMDVLRAAQSEVEHYTRIEFLIIDQDIEIAAHAVNDLVHLVAELFDNATAFSPPDSSIRIEARRVGDKAVLRVEDRGIGMSPDLYAELNERLATPPMVDVAVSRMMGLVVVARLAARHGVRVELLPAPERGTIADVMLPSGVLVPRSLGGRTHAPSGFPAVRPPDPPPRQSSPFGPPLALESGPAAGSNWDARSEWEASGNSGWDDGRGGHPTGPPLGMPPTFGPGGAPHQPAPMPTFSAYDNPAPAGGGGGLGAALAGAGAYTGLSNGGNGHATTTTNGGGRLPAWHDLTGANPNGGAAPGGAPPGFPPTPPAGPGSGFGPTDGRLPQRRPLGDEESPAIPRQTAGFEAPPAFDAPPGFGPSGFGPGGGFGPSGPTPGFGSMPAPAGPPPLGAAPPAWPPASDGPRPGAPVELPRRGVDTPSGAPQANDMTMELPIFRELESAWFAAGSAASEAATVVRPPVAWSPGGAGASAMAGSRTPGWPPQGEGAGAPAEEVSWRTHADDGWRAAQAASQPQDGGTTDMGLPRRVPMAQLVPGGVDTQSGASDRRTPDSVRGLLSAYTRGVQRGRDAHGSSDEYTSGREQEA